MPLRKLDSGPGTLGLAVNGILTNRDVGIIRLMLEAEPPSQDVVVDLRGGPTPLAPVLLELAAIKSAAGERLHLRGLTTATERLLKILGIDLGKQLHLALGDATPAEE